MPDEMLTKTSPLPGGESLAPKEGRAYRNEAVKHGILHVNRVATSLHLDVLPGFLNDCAELFGAAFDCAPPRSQCRNAPLLALAVVNRVASRRMVALPRREIDALLPPHKTRRQLHATMVVVSRACPQGDPRTQVGLLGAAILERLECPAPVVSAFASILQSRLSAFRSAKPAVVAGAMILAAVLAAGSRGSVSGNVIARVLRVSESAILNCLARAATTLGAPGEGTPGKRATVFETLLSPRVA